MPVVHFWRIRHECDITFEVFEQHRENALLNLPVCTPWNATQFKWEKNLQHISDIIF